MSKTARIRNLSDFRTRYPLSFEAKMDSVRYQERLTTRLFDHYLTVHNLYMGSRDKLRADFALVRYNREAYKLENDLGLALLDA